jgi:uncharacterized protein
MPAAPPQFVAPPASHDPSRPIFRRPGEPPVGGQPPTGGIYGAGPATGPLIPGGIYGVGPSSWQPQGSPSSPMGFPGEDPVRPWPWWIALVGLATAIVAVIAAGIALAAVVGIVTGDTSSVSDYDYLFGLLQDVLWVAVAIGVPLMVVRWIRPEHLGLRGRPLGWSALKAVIVLVGFYVLAAVYAGILGLDENSNQLLKDTGFGDTTAKDVAYAILYPVAAPVAEELLFRGILFKGLRDGLRDRLGRGGAVALAALLSGAIFGGAHLGGGQDAFIPVLIALGVLLALAYEWSGTIYVPILIHAVNNAIATGSSAEPTADWIYAIIVAAPILAVLTAMALARIVRRLPSEPPRSLPPSLTAPPPAWPIDGPQSGRPPGV